MQHKYLARPRRQLIDFFSDKNIYKPSISGSNNKINMPVSDAALANGIGSPGQAGRKVVGQLMEDGGELIRTPIRWIKDIQANWLIYIVCAAIICVSVLYLYCMVRKHLGKRRGSNSGFTSQLADLALAMAKTQQHHHVSTDANVKKQSLVETTADQSSTKY
jgi:hypothetical protein